MIFLLREMRAPSKRRLLRPGISFSLWVSSLARSLALGQPHYHDAYKISVCLNMEQLMTGSCSFPQAHSAIRSKKHKTQQPRVSFGLLPPKRNFAPNRRPERWSLIVQLGGGKKHKNFPLKTKFIYIYTRTGHTDRRTFTSRVFTLEERVFRVVCVFVISQSWLVGAVSLAGGPRCAQQ